MRTSRSHPYQTLTALGRKSALYNSIQSLLGWDQETYMPPAAIQLRSDQLALMATLVHKERTNKSFETTLARMIDLDSGVLLDPTLSEEQAAAVKVWRYDFLQLKRLPHGFISKYTHATSNAMHAWSHAKKERKFSLFAPHLDKVVTLLRKKAELLGYQEHPYDALVDLYEPGMTTLQIERLFTRLKVGLSTLFKAIRMEPELSDQCLYQHFPEKEQMAFCKLLLDALGCPHNASRLDLSAHPFCSGPHPKDVRMTTHIHPQALSNSLFSTIHECGHALYQMGLPEEHFGTPLGDPISLGIHESQSRWWETFVAQSYPFWEYFYPKLRAAFPDQLRSVGLDSFYSAVNFVKPHTIRIESDEVTYSLHIIARFELEKALLEGTLAVADLPAAWNAKMREFLGVIPTHDGEGCLQDIHWAMGGIGYFPTYTLGNLYAAQMFDTFAQTFPEWDEAIAQGDLRSMHDWLSEQVYRHGRRYSATELIQRISGQPLSEEFFLTYLHKKYSTLYKLHL